MDYIIGNFSEADEIIKTLKEFKVLPADYKSEIDWDVINIIRNSKNRESALIKVNNSDKYNIVTK